MVGATDGEAVGDAVVGAIVGLDVCSLVGLAEGAFVNVGVLVVGDGVSMEGACDNVGERVGRSVGFAVGSKVRVFSLQTQERCV